MSAFSEASAVRYTRLFNRYGSDGSTDELQIVQVTGQVIDQVDQTRTGGTPVVTNLVGMISRFENEEIDGQRVTTNDALVNINNAIIPSEEDIIIISGRRHTIMNIREVKTNEVIIGYVLHVRK
jgi:hypothetical protein